MKAVIFKNSSLIATHVTDQKQQEFFTVHYLEHNAFKKR